MINKIVPVTAEVTTEVEEILFISHPHLNFSLKTLKFHIHFRYTLLTSIAGLDYLHSKYRFCLAYDLLSILQNSRIRLKIFVNEITFVETVEDIFFNANWWEREIWDLFGIYFKFHSDLRRILTDYGFEGFPMRKDFPLSGYFEVRFDQTKNRVILEPISLAQSLRFFCFETPWEL